MRWIGILGILCLAVAPALGDACVYTFDVDGGNSDIEVTIQGEGATVMALDGTFDATIYASNGHIGSSDTFVLSSAGVVNTEAGKIGGILGLLTANVGAGDLQLIDFDGTYPEGGIHIGEGGAFSATSGAKVDAYAKVVVTGIFTTTLSTTVTSEVVEISGTISTSVSASDTISITLNMLVGDVPITFTVLGGTTTLFLDLDVHLEGTAHMSPDPALGGLITLGLGGAGTWLRRRRRA